MLSDYDLLAAMQSRMSFLVGFWEVEGTQTVKRKYSARVDLYVAQDGESWKKVLEEAPPL